MLGSAALLLAAAGSSGSPAEARPEVWCEYEGLAAPVDTSRVRLWLDGVDVSPRAEVGPARVRYVPAAPLSPGSHHVRLVVHDVEGRSAEKRWSFHAGATDGVEPAAVSPRLRFVPPTPANGALLGPAALAHPLVVAVQADSPDGHPLDPRGLRLSVAGGDGPERPPAAEGAAAAPTGVLELRVELEAASGRYLLRAAYEDASGRHAGPILGAFALDLEPPALLGLRAVEGEEEGRVRIEARVEDAPFDGLASLRLEVWREAARVAAWSLPPRAGPVRVDWAHGEGGRHQVVLVATDLTGNRSEARLALVVAGAPGLPAAPMSLRLDRVPSIVAGRHLELRGWTRAGARVEVRVNGTLAGDAVAEASGRFRMTVPLEEGPNRIVARAMGADGRPRSDIVRASARVRADWEPPAAPTIDEPADGAVLEAGAEGVVVGGRAEPGATVEVLVDGRPAFAGRADRAGRYRVGPVPLAGGAAEISVRARDEAGHRGAASRPARVRRAGHSAPPGGEEKGLDGG